MKFVRYENPKPAAFLPECILGIPTPTKGLVVLLLIWVRFFNFFIFLFILVLRY
jgi:hypothetical protein